MDAVSTPTQLHSLNDKWDMYYHLPQDKNWKLDSYIVINSSIDNIETMLKLNESIHDNIIKNSMLFIMKSGITPMWEDPKNREGGCFSYKITNKFIVDVWKKLALLLCGNSLCIKPEHNQHINGITISPKKNFCILKIWLNVSTLQDPSIITTITNLSTQGCLFKKHEPEY
jgi:hypothetical protein|uniref:Eukaryotic translation initiation factor 4E n=1 Tax=viral metagenome TaxID=1070528 RepID=A0A6C0ISV0_9ZZZZ